MDRICCCVLEKISSLAPLGRYVVVSSDELLESFPEEADKNYSELKKAVKALSAEGFIDLKYQDGEYFCAAPLKKLIPAEPEAENVLPEPQPEVKAVKKSVKSAVFWAAFAGGLAGGAAGSLIISLILALV